jgi:hypothetical protein
MIKLLITLVLFVIVLMVVGFENFINTFIVFVLIYLLLVFGFGESKTDFETRKKYNFYDDHAKKMEEEQESS